MAKKLIGARIASEVPAHVTGGNVALPPPLAAAARAAGPETTRKSLEVKEYCTLPGDLKLVCSNVTSSGVGSVELRDSANNYVPFYLKNLDDLIPRTELDVNSNNDSASILVRHGNTGFDATLTVKNGELSVDVTRTVHRYGPAEIVPDSNIYTNGVRLPLGIYVDTSGSDVTITELDGDFLASVPDHPAVFEAKLASYVPPAMAAGVDAYVLGWENSGTRYYSVWTENELPPALPTASTVTPVRDGRAASPSGYVDLVYTGSGDHHFDVSDTPGGSVQYDVAGLALLRGVVYTSEYVDSQGSYCLVERPNKSDLVVGESRNFGPALNVYFSNAHEVQVCALGSPDQLVSIDFQEVRYAKLSLMGNDYAVEVSRRLPDKVSVRLLNLEEVAEKSGCPSVYECKLEDTNTVVALSASLNLVRYGSNEFVVFSGGRVDAFLKVEIGETKYAKVGSDVVRVTNSDEGSNIEFLRGAQVVNATKSMADIAPNVPYVLSDSTGARVVIATDSDVVTYGHDSTPFHLNYITGRSDMFNVTDKLSGQVLVGPGRLLRLNLFNSNEAAVPVLREPPSPSGTLMMGGAFGSEPPARAPAPIPVASDTATRRGPGGVLPGPASVSGPHAPVSPPTTRASPKAGPWDDEVFAVGAPSRAVRGTSNTGSEPVAQRPSPRDGTTLRADFSPSAPADPIVDPESTVEVDPSALPSRPRTFKAWVAAVVVGILGGGVFGIWWKSTRTPQTHPTPAVVESAPRRSVPLGAPIGAPLPSADASVQVDSSVPADTTVPAVVAPPVVVPAPVVVPVAAVPAPVPSDAGARRPRSPRQTGTGYTPTIFVESNQ
ncbi:hypothetical protein HY990_02430 [Candidatus Micrarchaeota archaeon]|nr:hypothetical protein [Candidatus Micrarchaeota archaeon]